MCFTIDPDYPKIQIAIKDIICYKGVSSYENNYCTSYFTGFKYEIGKSYKTKIKFPIINQFLFFKKYNKKTIMEGFHSYKEIPDDYHIIFKCIIPKGSKYYYSGIHLTYNLRSDSVYVSDQIIIKENIRHW